MVQPSLNGEWANALLVLDQNQCRHSSDTSFLESLSSVSDLDVKAA